MSKEPRSALAELLGVPADVVNGVLNEMDGADCPEVSIEGAKAALDDLYTALKREGVDVAELRREIETDDRLLAGRDAFVAGIAQIVGECPAHGAACLPHLQGRVADLRNASRAALRYDAAIQLAARHGHQWTGGEDLDTLYMAWIRLAKNALGDASPVLPPGDDEVSQEVLEEVERILLCGDPRATQPVGILSPGESPAKTIRGIIDQLAPTAPQVHSDDPRARGREGSQGHRALPAEDDTEPPSSTDDGVGPVPDPPPPAGSSEPVGPLPLVDEIVEMVLSQAAEQEASRTDEEWHKLGYLTGTGDARVAPEASPAAALEYWGRIDTALGRASVWPTEDRP